MLRYYFTLWQLILNVIEKGKLFLINMAKKSIKLKLFYTLFLNLTIHNMNLWC